MLVSCLCFAEMSIYFRFGEFRENSRSICPIFREGHAEFLYDFDAYMHFIINLFIITMQAFMMVSGTVVDRWLRSAM